MEDKRHQAQINRKLELIKKQQELKAFLGQIFATKAKTTITSYTSTISTYFDELYKSKDKSLVMFVSRHKLLLEALMRRTTRPSSRKAVLAVFMTFAKRLLDDPSVTINERLKKKIEYSYNFYHTHMLLFSKEVDKERMENKLTEKMDETYLPWGDVLRYRDHITQSCESKANPSACLSMSAIMAEMMCEMVPGRGEYGSIKLRNFNKEKDNYIEGLDGNEEVPLVIVINKYKTAGLYGARQIHVFPESKLWTYLKTFYARFPQREYLFGSGLCEPRGADALKRYLISPSREFFGDNISLGSQSLRRAFISFIYSQKAMSLNEKATIAKLACHSLKMSQTYDRIKHADGTPIEKETNVEIPKFEINDKAVAIRTGRGKYRVVFTSE